MARVRCITEMGMGVDVHGRDATEAAKRAVSDAIRHSSLGFFRMLGKTANDMFVDVMIAVPNPDAVDTAAVAKELGIGESNLGGWLAKDREQRAIADPVAYAVEVAESEENKRLRRRVAELEVEREILKRSMVFWVKESNA